MADKTGIMIATALGGGLLLWSGISNKGVLTSARDLLQGNKPVAGATQSFSVNLGSLGGSGAAATTTAATGAAQLSPSASAAKANAKLQAAARGWTGQKWDDLVTLWMGESGFRWNATNPGSGAYGIPQALPASKMASAGADWKTNATTQIKWGLDYIEQTYGDPSKALAAWKSRNPHWY